MHDSWVLESWTHLMGQTDELLADIRRMLAELPQAETLGPLLAQAEQQREAALATLHHLAAQRAALLATLDALHRELAVQGRPLRGEIS